MSISILDVKKYVPWSESTRGSALLAKLDEWGPALLDPPAIPGPNPSSATFHQAHITREIIPVRSSLVVVEVSLSCLRTSLILLITPDMMTLVSVNLQVCALCYEVK